MIRTGWVLRVGDLLETDQTNDARHADTNSRSQSCWETNSRDLKDHLQATQSKHDHQGDLLLSGDVDCDQRRNGNEQDDKVGRDVHTRVGEPQTGLAQAEAGDGVVPELGHRDTGQKCADHHPSAVDAQDGDHDPADDAHFTGWKDTEVLQQDRGLGAKDGGVVEGDGEPECLGERLSGQMFSRSS